MAEKNISKEHIDPEVLTFTEFLKIGKVMLDDLTPEEQIQRFYINLCYRN